MISLCGWVDKAGEGMYNKRIFNAVHRFGVISDVISRSIFYYPGDTGNGNSDASDFAAGLEGTGKPLFFERKETGMTREKYETLPLTTLRELAKARKMKGVSALKKSDLIDAMLALDAQEEQAEAATEAKSK